MILEMRDICKDYPMGKSVAHILKIHGLCTHHGNGPIGTQGAARAAARAFVQVDDHSPIDFEFLEGMSGHGGSP